MAVPSDGEVRIELIGGPECGRVLRDAYLNEKVTVNGSTYRRRDRGYGAQERTDYLVNKNRAYDYINPHQRTS
jgi:hypothetical protein